MSTRVRAAALAVLGALALLLTGCSTGHDAAVYGGSFTFVSPGGKSEFSYPAGKRDTLTPLSGPSVTDNKTIAVADYPGKVVVLNFWGSWCGPCRAEADDLEQASKALAPKGVQFIGVDVKDTQSDAADFLASHQITYPSIFDPTMRTLLAVNGYPAGAIPSTIVLDRDHRVAHIWLSPVSAAQLETVVGAIAGENGTSDAAQDAAGR